MVWSRAIWSHAVCIFSLCYHSRLPSLRMTRLKSEGERACLPVSGIRTPGSRIRLKTYQDSDTLARQILTVCWDRGHLHRAEA